MLSFALPFLYGASLVSAYVVQPELNAEAYDKGVYGIYPTKHYISSHHLSPRYNVLLDDPVCNDGSLVFISPRGNRVNKANPMILDWQGELVWTLDGYSQNYQLSVQEYKGETYLTFWAGDDGVRGHGAGTYYMMNHKYEIVKEINAANGLDADLHEFLITDQNTGLLTVYEIVPADLTSVGRSPYGWIWEGIVQEIDLETGELLFEWRASQHYDFTDSYHLVGRDGDRNNPWDWFHINSIEKDDKGNYLVSSRYMRTVTYIDGTSGDILWVIGGKRNSFKDLSGGEATNNMYQHHARWHDNYTTITIFDNGAEDSNYVKKYSRGMWVKPNFDDMTMELIGEFINPQQFVSRSQGSVQVLPNGNVLVGYGVNGAHTEFDRNGTALCDIHWCAASTFNSGDAQSYRTFKGNWTGYPQTPPDIEIADGHAYVSWNGATEVRSWMLQRAEREDAGEEEWHDTAVVQRTGFETRIALDGDLPFVRVVGLSSGGEQLGATRAMDSGQSSVWKAAHAELYDSDFTPMILFLILLAIAGTAIFCTDAHKSCSSCCGRSRSKGFSPLNKAENGHANNDDPENGGSPFYDSFSKINANIQDVGSRMGAGRVSKIWWAVVTSIGKVLGVPVAWHRRWHEGALVRGQGASEQSRPLWAGDQWHGAGGSRVSSYGQVQD